MLISNFTYLCATYLYDYLIIVYSNKANPVSDLILPYSKPQSDMP